MKLMSTNMPIGAGAYNVVLYVVTSPLTYTFITVNFMASLSYVITLRGATMIQAFGMVYASMSIAVLAIDILINNETLTLQAGIGFLLALFGILLLGMH